MSAKLTRTRETGERKAIKARFLSWAISDRQRPIILSGR